MTKIIVHHLKRSRSHRILWLLEELGLPYEIKEYDRVGSDQRAPESLRKVHPLGRAPVVEVDGQVFAESGAIIETLLELGDTGLRPEAGTEAFRRYRFFLHYAEGSLMPPLLVGLILSRLRTAKLPIVVKQIARSIADKIDGAYTNKEVKNHAAFLESELREREFLTGDVLTGADVQMSYAVEGLLTRTGESTPHLRAYLSRIKERPAYQRAVSKGGPAMLEK